MFYVKFDSELFLKTWNIPFRFMKYYVFLCFFLPVMVIKNVTITCIGILIKNYCTVRCGAVLQVELTLYTNLYAYFYTNFTLAMPKTSIWINSCLFMSWDHMWLILNKINLSVLKIFLIQAINLKNEVNNQVLQKKLPLSMDIQRLKVLICKLFKEADFDFESLSLFYTNSQVKFNFYKLFKAFMYNVLIN